MLITNHPWALTVSKWPTDPIAIWGIQAYSFILPHNVPHTALELANLIPLYYDETEPHTAAVITALKKIEARAQRKMDQEALALNYQEAIIKSRKG